ncbi:hypothetical protein A5844_000505 [Enterococcus sp. 10A9_DIV0425]|uniref:Helix-turn-helix domain-containing protein n=1 Tax=Candidatus Enterococcus wittei TaxID=1987383 RepID=A0A2C9XPZ9_9ENTE|nr:helix-turn-helix domain-containing protein [Enterococcus sp. 10A9_DIV0425]OTP12273.1 hypothetical protein A5844_000505 [Enterococcus sp. 10A9_DIV0425]THE13224.1 helix-turn-helix domain-containing protein [Enterococcus hirae]
MNNYYSVNELAEKIGVTTRSIRNYLREGKLKGRKIGGKWKFSEQDLAEFLNGTSGIIETNRENTLSALGPVTMKFSIYYEDLSSLYHFRDNLCTYHSDVYANKKDRFFLYNLLDENHVEIIIGGNFNYVMNFGTWINNQLLNETNISLIQQD